MDIFQAKLIDIVFSAIEKLISIELQNCCIKSLLVSSDGIINLTDHNNATDFAENFDDTVLYEVYQTLQKNDTIIISTQP